MSNNLSILIPDGESNFTIFVARCLAQIPGLQLHILSSDPWDPLRFSRYRHIFLNRAADLAAEQYVDVVCQAAQQTNAAIILPVSEEAIGLFSTYRDAFADVTTLAPLPTGETFKIAVNKWLLAEFIKKKNCPV